MSELKIEIEFSGEWVLKHRGDDVLPVAALKSELSKNNALKITDESLTSITLVCAEADGESGLKDAVINFFKSRYPEDNPNDVMTFSSEVVETKKADGQSGEGLTKEQCDDIINEIFADAMRKIKKGKQESGDEEDEEESADKADKEDKEDKAAANGGTMEKINALVGAAEFKALAKEISEVAAEIRRTDTYEVFTNQCYLFSIGDGCGLSTYLNLLSGLISDNELCKISVNPVREVRLGEYRESSEPFSSAVSAIEYSSGKNVKIVCVDISEWMDRINNRYFRDFLRAVEKHADESIVVFRVPFVDKDVLARIRYSLSDLLSVKAISFPPLNRGEMKIYAEEQLKNYGFTVTKPSWKYFFQRISEEKSDGKFYGINSVKKVIRELVYQKHIANARRHSQSKLITVTDVKALCRSESDGNLSGMAQLDKLVGVESIKKRVEEIIAQIELSLKDGSGQRPCIHMRFVGNPGTGKTTVARIIGKILKERGVLRVGAFFEYAGRDFCGRYIGETAPKTASICRDAYGSVLFIDEAYSLYRGDGDTKDFGREAIDTLIAEMENHRNDFVVIMAGYTNDMEKLMGGNQGLASRMPYVIEFPNFTREQLYDIFESMTKNKFRCDGGLLEAARDFFLNLPEEVISSKDFSNARYVRNLFERTWAKAAMRCQLSGKTEVVLTRDDFEHASADKEFVNNNSKKTRIGF